MAKQLPRSIQELTAATEYGASDYLVISNSLTKQDRKIVKEDFIDSMGNPTIDGYTSVSESVNNYTLTPAAGEPTTQYLNGMTVRFVADADSTGAVQIKIVGGLPYRNLLQLGTATTSSIVQGEYYEAVYIGNNAAGIFYQTNVQAATLPTVTGYTESSTTANEITLTPANGVVLDSYYNGMIVEFVSPINNTGLPKLKIGALAPKYFYKFGQVATEAPFITGDHYRATYVAADNAFYQTNLAEVDLFTNEYVAVGTVALDELSTTYQLTSAIGAPKTFYYNVMTLFFVADIASKGVVFVNIDGLGNKVLGEGDNDPIANNLYVNQPLKAHYDGTTGEFVKHRFAVTNPPAPPIDPDEPIPDENLVDITVGPLLPIKSIAAAITALVEEFGNDGGNRLATIHLANDFVWNKRTLITAGVDYSWITITSDFTIEIDTSSLSSQAILVASPNSIAPIISGSYNYSTGLANITLFVGFENSWINFKNATFVTTKSAILLCSCNSDSINLNTTNMGGFSLNGGYEAILENCNITRTSSLFNGHLVIGNNASYVINNCSITSSVMTSATINILGGNVEIINSTVSANINNCVLVQNSAVVSLVDCRVNSLTNVQTGLYATKGAQVSVDGGDYRTNDNSVVTTNIVADGTGTIIRLENAPLGGTSTTNNGQIITV